MQAHLDSSLTTASPDEDLPDVVYLEHLTDARFLTKRGDVERYSGTAARLVFEAETPTRTPGILRVALHDPDEVWTPTADQRPAGATQPNRPRLR